MLYFTIFQLVKISLYIQKPQRYLAYSSCSSIVMSFHFFSLRLLLALIFLITFFIFIYPTILTFFILIFSFISPIFIPPIIFIVFFYSKYLFLYPIHEKYNLHLYSFNIVFHLFYILYLNFCLWRHFKKISDISWKFFNFELFLHYFILSIVQLEYYKHFTFYINIIT